MMDYGHRGKQLSFKYFQNGMVLIYEVWLVGVVRERILEVIGVVGTATMGSVEVRICELFYLVRAKACVHV